MAHHKNEALNTMLGRCYLLLYLMILSLKDPHETRPQSRGLR